jgi:hypothetical protein
MQKVQMPTVAGTLFVVALCISCTNRQDSSSYVRDRVNYLKEQTTPPDAFVKETGGPVLKGQVASVQWEFETAQTRSDYLRWVADRLQSTYTQSSSRLVFVRHSGGDSESVTIEADLAKDKLHVHIIFVTYPD